MSTMILLLFTGMFSDLDKFFEKAPSSTESVRFDFGSKVLWIDKVSSLSQAEIWLEVVTNDLAGASQYLEDHGCVRRDEIEALPDGLMTVNISE